MIVNLITKEDLKEFKTELLEDIKNLFNIKVSEQKLWLRSSEVKELLKISSGTLQNLRINGTLSYTRVGGTLYYNYKDIEKMLSPTQYRQHKPTIPAIKCPPIIFLGCAKGLSGTPNAKMQVAPKGAISMGVLVHSAINPMLAIPMSPPKAELKACVHLGRAGLRSFVLNFDK